MEKRKNRQKLLDENEVRYGAEARKKYGAEAVGASLQKVKGMSDEAWARAQALSTEINETLKAALLEGDPAGETAQRACGLHRQWLCLFWPEGLYSRQAHRVLGESYVSDPRFTAYYNQIAPGCAAFLRDALNIYCEEK